MKWKGMVVDTLLPECSSYYSSHMILCTYIHYSTVSDYSATKEYLYNLCIDV